MADQRYGGTCICGQPGGHGGECTKFIGSFQSVASCSVCGRPFGDCCTVQIREPKPLPFPPEVVERACRLHFDAIRERVPLEKQVDEVLTVLADYLRSDEVRRRVAKAVQQQAGYNGQAATYLEAADAVIAAMLGEKT